MSRNLTPEVMASKLVEELQTTTHNSVIERNALKQSTFISFGLKYELDKNTNEDKATKVAECFAVKTAGSEKSRPALKSQAKMWLTSGKLGEEVMAACKPHHDNLKGKKASYKSFLETTLRESREKGHCLAAATLTKKVKAMPDKKPGNSPTIKINTDRVAKFLAACQKTDGNAWIGLNDVISALENLKPAKGQDTPVTPEPDRDDMTWQEQAAAMQEQLMAMQKNNAELTAFITKKLS